MPAYEKIDGVWREVWSSHVKVDGVWRDIEMSSKVNDEWKTSHIHEIRESDIVGFRMIYKLNPNKQHPLFPDLKTNLNLPVTFALTGDDLEMNGSTKGVLYHYERFGEEEGILMYEASLYAILNNGCLVDVCLSKNTSVNNDDGRIPSSIPNITEVWATNRMKLLTIQLEGYVLFESYRYHLYGWNSVFDTAQFLLQEPYAIDAPYRDIKIFDSMSILPIENRLGTFDTIASIGVARNLKTVDTMYGAYGTIDHTIKSIKVNGVIKPFIIEIYN